MVQPPPPTSKQKMPQRVQQPVQDLVEVPRATESTPPSCVVTVQMEEHCCRSTILVQVLISSRVQGGLDHVTLPSHLQPTSLGHIDTSLGLPVPREGEHLLRVTQMLTELDPPRLQCSKVWMIPRASVGDSGGPGHRKGLTEAS